jgi:N-acylneuraminate cytidylyltransferase
MVIKRILIFKKMKIVSIILARGGSKGLPGKNVMNFCGLPLVAWSVLQSKLSNKIDDIFISSDDDKILEICNEYGAQKIKRPKELAQDDSRSEDAIIHALKSINNNYDYVVMLEPTAPLRKKNDLDDCIRQCTKESWDSGFSSALLEDFLIWKKDQNNNLASVNYDYKFQLPRQMREPDYVENGGIYIFKPEIILKNNNRFGGKIGTYLTNFWQSFEIDNKEDWDFVKLVFEKKLLETYKEHI